jgi:hypothetical protein
MTLVQPSTDRSARRRHWEMLVICLAVVLLSFLLVIRADGRVAPRGLTGLALPETCLTHSLFGFDCPACGLTRSFIELSRGNFSGSLTYHNLGWMMALAVVLQIPYRAFCLWTQRSLAARVSSSFGLAIIVALIGRWMILMAMH